MQSGLLPEFALLVNNLYAPSGTSIPMAQASAPLGWTSSAVTDTSLRYNSSTGGASAGSTAWSSWNFGGTFNVTTFVLTEAQLPVHAHVINDPGHSHPVSDPGHTHTASVQMWGTGSAGGDPTTFGSGSSTISYYTAFLAAAATGVTTTPVATGITTANQGLSSNVTPTYTTPQVKYVDHILAVKS